MSFRRERTASNRIRDTPCLLAFNVKDGAAGRQNGIVAVMRRERMRAAVNGPCVSLQVHLCALCIKQAGSFRRAARRPAVMPGTHHSLQSYQRHINTAA
jgi:hypothetical protein